MSNRGYFITLEGGEGTGKSTLMKKLAESFKLQGIDVVTTREPGGTKLSEQIRSLLLDSSDLNVCDRAELMLFLASRAQHVKDVIRPALNEGKVVICDRFNDSSIAYQGGARGFGLSEVEHLCRFVCEDTWPDKTILLDLDPVIGLKRSTTRDRLESEELIFHEKVRESYLHLADLYKERFVVIDAHQDVEVVFLDALKGLKEF